MSNEEITENKHKKHLSANIEHRKTTFRISRRLADGGLKNNATDDISYPLLYNIGHDI